MPSEQSVGHGHATVGATCPHCGVNAPPDSRYCPQCGAGMRKLSKDDALGLFGFMFAAAAAFCHFMRGGGK